VKKDFIDWCKNLLEVGGENEMTNYCGRLCVELADVVQGISDQHSNRKQQQQQQQQMP